MVETVATRICSTCGLDLPLTTGHFARRSNAPKPADRFAYMCRDCKSVDNRTRYLRKRLVELRERAPRVVRQLVDVERDAIEDAVLIAPTLKKAAELLGIGTTTLNRKLIEYANLQPRDPSRWARECAQPNESQIKEWLEESEGNWRRLRTAGQVRGRERNLIALRALVKFDQDYHHDTMGEA